MDPNAPQPTPAPAPAAAPAPAPAPEQPLFANNSAPVAGGAPKKSHTGLIVGLIVGIIAIAAILIVVFAVIIPNANKDGEKKDDNNSKEEKKTDPEPEPEPEPEPVSKTKTLVCTQTQTTSSYKLDGTATMTFKDDKLTKVVLVETDWFEETISDEEWEEYKESLKDFDKEKYTSYEVSKVDSHTVKVSAELKISEANTGEFNSYEKAKEYMTEKSFTCK